MNNNKPWGADSNWPRRRRKHPRQVTRFKTCPCFNTYDYSLWNLIAWLQSSPAMQQSGLAMWKKGNLKLPRPRAVEPPRYTSRQHCPKTITFIEAGERHSLQPRSVTGLLASAEYCLLKVDTVKQLSFPDHIATLHPDMVIFSNSTKQAFLVSSHSWTRTTSGISYLS